MAPKRGRQVALKNLEDKTLKLIGSYKGYAEITLKDCIKDLTTSINNLRTCDIDTMTRAINAAYMLGLKGEQPKEYLTTPAENQTEYTRVTSLMPIADFENLLIEAQSVAKTPWEKGVTEGIAEEFSQHGNKLLILPQVLDYLTDIVWKYEISK